MYKTSIQNAETRKAAAMCLRVARETFKRPDEIFGFAITIATNLTTIDRQAGKFAQANHYRDAAKALRRAN